MIVIVVIVAVLIVAGAWWKFLGPGSTALQGPLPPPPGAPGTSGNTGGGNPDAEGGRMPAAPGQPSGGAPR
jgi:hypothetical protein